MSATRIREHRAVWPWVVLGVFLVNAALGMVLVAANRGSLAEQWLFAATFFLFGLVGALIVSRVPGNRIGALLLYVSGVTSVSFVAGEFVTSFVHRGDTGALVQWLSISADAGWVFGLIPGLLLLPQLFPDGRPASRRWRWLLWATFTSLGVFLLGIAGSRYMDESSSVPNPIYVPALEPFGTVIDDIFLVFLFLVGASIVSLVMRFRRARGLERQQIRWMAFAAALMLSGLVFSEVVVSLGVSDTVSPVFAAAGMAALPARSGSRSSVTGCGISTSSFARRCSRGWSS